MNSPSVLGEESRACRRAGCRRGSTPTEPSKSERWFDLRGRVGVEPLLQRWCLAVAVFLLPCAALAGPTGDPEPELRLLLAEAITDSDSFNDRFDAEVWLTDMSGRLQRFIKDDAERLEFLRLLHREATRARVPPELALAVIEVESRFDRFAISSAGAQGYMQIMPFWLKEIAGPEENLFHAKTNLRMGCTILRFYLDKEHGNLSAALARYNGSFGKPKYPDLVLRVLNRRWYRG